METLRITAELVPEEEGGYTVYCPELDIYTQGESEEECLGNLREAAEILLDSNPIPSITGRVCPHFCEQLCNRDDFDEAVSVRDIERFMGDYILDNADEIVVAPETDTGKSVVIKKNYIHKKD